MRLTCLVLIGLFVWGNGCLAAPDDDNGEVRLYVRAAYTGYHTRQTRSRGTGKTAPTTEERVQDKLTVVFQGTSTWRIKDWVPSDLTHNCAVSANGGGSWVETERGMDGCGNGAGGDHPYVSTDIGRWTYEVPAATKDYPPPMSPAGMVTVNPVGQWVLALFALANVEDLAPKGSWFNRYAGCKGTTQTDHPVDADNAPPPRSEAIYMVQEAFHTTMGAGGKFSAPVMGQWDLKEKGFYASGHLYDDGGDRNIPLGEPPSGKPDDGYFTGTEARYWTADIFYTASYTMSPPPVECIIETGPEYREWVPQGGANEETEATDCASPLTCKSRESRTRRPCRRASSPSSWSSRRRSRGWR